MRFGNCSITDSFTQAPPAERLTTWQSIGAACAESNILPVRGTSPLGATRSDRRESGPDIELFSRLFSKYMGGRLKTRLNNLVKVESWTTALRSVRNQAKTAPEERPPTMGPISRNIIIATIAVASAL